MKTIMLVAGAATGVLFLSGAAHAQDAGWYLRGEIGGSFQGELDADDAIDLDNGFGVGIATGYDFANGLRTEGELLHLKNDVEGSSDGDVSSIGGFANVIYDFNRGGAFQPFLGAGVGLAQVDLDNGAFDDDDSGLAYQAKAGVAYKINDRLSAELAYRYVVVTDLEFGSGASGIDGDYDSQLVTVGLRYKFR